MMHVLDDEERYRYSRQLLLPGFGEEGQRRLKEARILVVGAGGLGSPAALYLAAAGVGTLGIADFDTVARSNLQRQILFSDADVGVPKTEAARNRVEALNPGVDVVLHDGVDVGNARSVLAGYDVVVDGSDNFATRYLVNDAAFLEGVHYVYGSVFRFEGQLAVFPPDGPCYRCLYPRPPPPDLIPSCAEGGVLGVLPGVIGTLQATEAIKIAVGKEPLSGLFLYDALGPEFRTLRIGKDPSCPLCGDHPTITDVVAVDVPCRISDVPEVDGKGLDALFLDVRDPDEWQDGGPEASLRIPLWDLDRSVDTLPTDRPIVVFCKSGARSAQAVRTLRARDIDAFNLRGGSDAWESEGGPART